MVFLALELFGSEIKKKKNWSVVFSQGGVIKNFSWYS